ncbi:uncharacterized protein LOC127517607 [Ctenopharyngodon idella]|uniref:uncharacterized protein LOC127517607 n=1 Tax=Ctenopharyngodon idella TaxID=7959 RepID=UPI002231A02B|nr:uncharacterized protein LOC127517607 [Ctenopharyngodon idella]
MSFRLCVTGCGRSLVPPDGHNHCITCLGVQHTEAAFVDSSCSHCGNMTIAVLRSRLSFLGSQGAGVPSPMPRSAVFYGFGRGDGVSACRQGDLRITVRASSPSATPRAPVPSTSLQPVVFLTERAGPSTERPAVSFGAPADDRMSIVAPEGEQESSGDEDSAVLPPSGTVALSKPDPELTAMLSRAAEKVGLVWNPPPCPEPSRLDDWYLGEARAGPQRPAPMPFFPEVHDEVTRSWRTPYSVRARPGPSSTFTKNAEQLVHAFMTSRLDYCNALLGGCSARLINKLQLVQNAAARVLTRTRKYDHISPVLSTLHWLPVKHRIDFKILLITYKALNGLAPQYLSELLIHYSPSRLLRSQNSGQLIIPRISKSTAGGRSFSYLAPKLWNNLPSIVREADTFCQFKSRLKTHLFNLAYT